MRSIHSWTPKSAEGARHVQKMVSKPGATPLGAQLSHEPSHLTVTMHKPGLGLHWSPGLAWWPRERGGSISWEGGCILRWAQGITGAFSPQRQQDLPRSAQVPPAKESLQNPTQNHPVLPQKAPVMDQGSSIPARA